MIIHPTIENLMNSIATNERLKECYELRLKLINTDYSKKTAYEKNEIDILETKTKNIIQNIGLLILEQKAEFNETYGRYIEELTLQQNDVN
jgi:hypothetical protein